MTTCFSAVAGHPYNLRPDRPDHRDCRAPHHLVSGTRILPSTDYRMDPAMPPIWDQSTLGCCAEHAVLAAVVYLAAKQGLLLPTDMLSRLFAYYQGRVLEGTMLSDAGLGIRDAIKVNADFGVPHEALWGYDVEQFTVRPTMAAYLDAPRHKVGGYTSLGPTFDAFCAALSQGKLVVLGMTIFPSFEDTGADGYVPTPRAGEKPLGGHALLGVGHERVNSEPHGGFFGPIEDRLFGMSSAGHGVARNHWTDSWGDKGHAYLDRAHWDRGYVFDQWTIDSVAFEKEPAAQLELVPDEQEAKPDIAPATDHQQAAA